MTLDEALDELKGDAVGDLTLKVIALVLTDIGATLKRIEADLCRRKPASAAGGGA